MKKWLFTLIAAFMSFGFVVESVEAKRLGGGRSTGVQREAVTPQKPTATPSQQQAAPSQAAPAAAANPAAAAPKPGMGRWLAPLAGLAAGLGLAYLLGDQLGAVVMALLIAALIAFAVMFVLRRMRPQQQPARQQGGLQYAGMGQETVAAPPPSQPVQMGSGIGSQVAPRIPAGFDVEGFLRQAKKSFVALQDANDKKDLEAIRELVTDELFASLKHDIDTRVGMPQQTDVVTLDAELLEVATEADAHWASIRFSGMLREEGSGAPSQFEEIWNLRKPQDGSAGWTLAGIQQAA